MPLHPVPPAVNLPAPKPPHDAARRLCLRCLTALIAAPVALPAPARRARELREPMAGTITKVLDGDSLVFQPKDGAPMEVRLRGIDAPEHCQTWGPESRKALAEMALGKPAQLTPAARDRYGRTVAEVVVDGRSLSVRMAEEGQAYSQRGRNDHGPLLKEERVARSLKRGMFTLATPPEMPRDYRRTHPRGHGACPAP